MLSKNKIKYIHSLELKKNRQADNVFVAEGPKVVGDLMVLAAPRLLFATAEWLAAHGARLRPEDTEIAEVTEDELRKISFLQHPQKVLAVFEQQKTTADAFRRDELTICLDGVQDPGNLGTIIRIADWFGIRTIICSQDTADVYNPKVVQATMGSIARVRVAYTDLDAFLGSMPDEMPVYGTLLDGKNIYGQQLTPHGILVMGNEGKGISPSVRRYLNRSLFIPNFSANSETAESLNVAVATAIVCSEFRRSTI